MLGMGKRRGRGREHGRGKGRGKGREGRVVTIGIRVMVGITISGLGSAAGVITAIIAISLYNNINFGVQRFVLLSILLGESLASVFHSSLPKMKKQAQIPLT